ncbi:MAG: hypothetical protein ACRCWR_04670 [Saezia sp.]
MTEIRGLFFWAIRYRSQAAAGTFFLGRPPFARAAAILAGVFAFPPLAPIFDAAQLQATKVKVRDNAVQNER